MTHRIGRRTLLSFTASGLSALLASRLLGPRAAFAKPGQGAKAVIVLWMNGGPSQLDTWDPKPGAPTGGPHKAIATSMPELSISEHMPLLAREANKLCVVRSGTSKEGNHQRAQYLMHTGYAPNPTVLHPSFGSWASVLATSAPSGLPSFVSIGGPSAGAGFFGVQNGPFVVQKAGELPQNVAALTDPARFATRQKLLDQMEQRFLTESGDAKVDGRRALYGKAMTMMQAPRLGAFDVTSEPEAVKKDYGATDFGRGCLVARRLVEAGVRYVEVTLDGWDTHKDNFGRTKALMGTLDPAMSALLRDLEARKLLDSTLVLWMGDFGRTPRINGTDGRDHYPQAWSAVLAGGGARRGYVHGATDARGEKVVKDPVTVPDLFATVATLAGIDPHESRTSPAGRPIAITDDGSAIKALIAP
jgi:uncharacterized protein (DUF1501 family)